MSVPFLCSGLLFIAYRSCFQNLLLANCIVMFLQGGFLNVCHGIVVAQVVINVAVCTVVYFNFRYFVVQLA